MLHAIVIAAGLVVTWTVVQEDARPPPRPIVADFRATTFLPVDELPVSTLETLDPPPVESTPPEPLEPVRSEVADATWAIFDAARAGRSDAADHDAGFAGVRATNARSVAYVIDASGSMTTWLPLVLSALSQSLDRLDSAQRYAVIFFQGDQAVVVPPGRLQPARSRAIRQTMEWTRRGANLMPGGGSNPLPALKAALRLEPDVIFLLSEGLEGSGGSTLDRSSMMAQLDELNPIADPVTASRWTRIQCIRIGANTKERGMTPSLMQAIADRYGGPGAWISLGRSDLVSDPGESP